MDLEILAAWHLAGQGYHQPPAVGRTAGRKARRWPGPRQTGSGATNVPTNILPAPPLAVILCFDINVQRFHNSEKAPTWPRHRDNVGDFNLAWKPYILERLTSYLGPSCQDIWLPNNNYNATLIVWHRCQNNCQLLLGRHGDTVRWLGSYGHYTTTDEVFALKSWNLQGEICIRVQKLKLMSRDQLIQIFRRN